ncbi:hypothetical protein ABT001_23880 [Streptomyces sp. NPDC002793]|uniref:hypothetical protein n=1 Tax=Streptomyces sp. NPDC002793 TaxID=3154432 RepID=UPI003321EA9B
MSLGQNLGVDVCRCPVAVFEDVVLVVQVGESFALIQWSPARLDFVARPDCESVGHGENAAGITKFTPQDHGAHE